MKNSASAFAFSTLILFAAAGTAIALRSNSAPDSDEHVTFNQCPAAVQKTILEYANGGTITGIERTTDHGEILYEADVRGGGGVIEFDVSESGAFRGYDIDDEVDDGEEDND